MKDEISKVTSDNAAWFLVYFSLPLMETKKFIPKLQTISLNLSLKVPAFGLVSNTL